MKIIIVGCGRVGQTLAQKLNEDGNDATHAVQVEAGVAPLGVLGRLKDCVDIRYAGGQIRNFSYVIVVCTQRLAEIIS